MARCSMFPPEIFFLSLERDVKSTNIPIYLGDFDFACLDTFDSHPLGALMAMPLLDIFLFQLPRVLARHDLESERRREWLASRRRYAMEVLHVVTDLSQ